MNKHSVKVIATLGPASNNEKRMRELIAEGVNIFRFNFAHDDPQEHGKRIQSLKRLSEGCAIPVGSLADISGPKIRLGKIPGDTATLEVGEVITLVSPGVKAEGLPVHLANFDTLVEPGDPIYIADGTRKLIVLENGKGIVRARVETGGAICSLKGINLPNFRKPLPAVGPKDLADAEIALRAGIDWLGLSFVGAPEDIKPVHELMQRIGIHRPILAKLERQQALDNLEAIIDAFDGVMVARGDLGIEVEFEKVPMIQERILREARKRGKPAVVATQILSSMVSNPRPTRAEATDIAFAVAGGADALMLSEESAIGMYPLESVSTLIKVSKEVELLAPIHGISPSVKPDRDEYALAHTAVTLAGEIGADAILCPTRTGNTVRAAARFHPRIPVIAISDSSEVVAEFLLYRNLYARFEILGDTLEKRISACLRFATELGFAEKCAKFVILAGVPAGSGQANLVFVHNVKQK